MLATQEEVTMIKGKRSKRPRLALTIATSSSSTADLSGGGVTSDASPSNSAINEEEEDMANCLILLAKGQGQRPAVAEAYQCKTCSKSFASFQALGGHRASHKKPNKPTNNLEETKKGLMMREKQESFVAEGDESTNLSLQIPNKPTRVHECSICGAEFGSGQALGGHMRRHRPIPTAASGGGESQGVMKRARNLLSLDLNLPAPDDHDDHPESKFPFAHKEQVIVFAASPLIDCHY
ncbi:hypothetical protein C2S53_016773 [Perilla frutescens var. hirtella]|uniref:C2H2-type domain-containing protein n=1 Tax=Perilla frutescens var. hirtella TaxID=608512 RepID=A0AAD4J1E2_PERFH|nr:hypothetical protein C2S53_016773 [Perilla frutescens var. hirtella]